MSSILFYSTRKPKISTELAPLFGFFNIHIRTLICLRTLCEQSKVIQKTLTLQKKVKGGPLWFLNIRTLKTLHPNFENVTSEIWNVISELWKRYIRTLKCYIRTLKTLHPNFETSYSNIENVASEFGNVILEHWGTLHPNFENVISEHWKRYIRSLKTSYLNFENVKSELLKRYIRTLKTLHPNFENVTSELWNVISKNMLWTFSWTAPVFERPPSP